MSREHVNVTGRVPEVSRGVALFLGLGWTVSLHRATLPGTANIIVNSLNAKRMAELRRELEVSTWAFTHDRPKQLPGRCREAETIVLLVTL